VTADVIACRVDAGTALVHTNRTSTEILVPVSEVGMARSMTNSSPMFGRKKLGTR
jgi:hypothetical protein